eukprot:GHVU01190336.1.p2 GENE.GHVU01190336.1~~GHVU01190336.1.p2  ORF type:complete len:109 (+),score=6.01 GHVU01190336.1:554-880(+)
MVTLTVGEMTGWAHRCRVGTIARVTEAVAETDLAEAGGGSRDPFPTKDRPINSSCRTSRPIRTGWILLHGLDEAGGVASREKFRQKWPDVMKRRTDGKRIRADTQSIS